jgi:hypothetical protein
LASRVREGGISADVIICTTLNVTRQSQVNPLSDGNTYVSEGAIDHFHDTWKSLPKQYGGLCVHLIRSCRRNGYSAIVVDLEDNVEVKQSYAVIIASR